MDSNHTVTNLNESSDLARSHKKMIESVNNGALIDYNNNKIIL